MTAGAVAPRVGAGAAGLLVEDLGTEPAEAETGGTVGSTNRAERTRNLCETIVPKKR